MKEKILKIKYTCINSKQDWAKHTPSSSFEINGCQFFKDDEDRCYDFWFIFETFKNSKIQAICNPQNTVLATGEPESILVLNKKYMNQFNYLITPQSCVKHKNKISFQLLPWLMSKNYDYLKNTEPPQKTKTLSVIISNKSFTEGHKARIELVKHLKDHFKDQIDVFGRGINDFKDKWDVISPYKYHIAIENSAEAYYCSEKLAESYLGYSYPLYWGCPNVKDYYPENSYTEIDIFDPQCVIEQIEKVISSNLYENRYEEIVKARNLVLDEYNMFAYIAEFAKQNYKKNNQKQRTIIKSEWTFNKTKYIAQNFKKRPVKYMFEIFKNGINSQNTLPL